MPLVGNLVHVVQYSIQLEYSRRPATITTDHRYQSTLCSQNWNSRSDPDINM